MEEAGKKLEVALRLKFTKGGTIKFASFFIVRK